MRGKRGRSDRLPLPVDVGEAIVAYLRPGDRPTRWTGRVRADPGAAPGDDRPGRRARSWRRRPRGLGSGRARISCGTPPRGRCCAAGASLPEIGQVLRHRQLQTTAIYAKVDRDALRQIARPWPGAAGMSALHDQLADYLAVRRALGYKLERERDSCSASSSPTSTQRGDEQITIELALAWATLPARTAADHAPAARERCAVSRATCTRSTPGARSRRPICCPAAASRASPTSTPTRRSPR